MLPLKDTSAPCSGLPSDRVDPTLRLAKRLVLPIEGTRPLFYVYYSLLTECSFFRYSVNRFKKCHRSEPVQDFGGFNLSMVIAIASQKGGVGKTSSAISLAAGLAYKGKRVLLIDIDSQANSSKVLLPDYPRIEKNQTVIATILNRSPLPVHQTNVLNLAIVPSHILLSTTDVELTTAIDHREERLKRELDALKGSYDYVFIDCPPTLSWLTINAFTAADKVLVVVAPGYFELDSIVQISKTIKEVRELFNPFLELAGFLFTMSDPTVNSKTSLQILRQTYTSSVLNTVIPRNTDLRDAHFQKRDIFSFSPKSPAAFAYNKLIAELFNL